MPDDLTWIPCTKRLPEKGAFVLGWENYWSRVRVYRFDGADGDGCIMWSDDSETPIDDDEFFPNPLDAPPTQAEETRCRMT